MRVPVSWLTDHVDGGLPADPEDIGEAFVRVGLEIEEIHRSEEIPGPLVVGRVLEITELTEFDRPNRVTVHVVDGPYPVDGTWTFRPAGTGTAIERTTMSAFSSTSAVVKATSTPSRCRNSSTSALRTTQPAE